MSKETRKKIIEILDRTLTTSPRDVDVYYNILTTSPRDVDVYYNGAIDELEKLLDKYDTQKPNED